MWWAWQGATRLGERERGQGVWRVMLGGVEGEGWNRQVLRGVYSGGVCECLKRVNKR